MKTFKEWIIESYDKEELKEIANHGCAGFAPGGLIYYHETSTAYDTYSEEIWDCMDEIKESMDFSSVLALLASFNGAKDVSSDSHFKNMMVWAYVEEIAREAIESNECRGE